jgi:Transposase IS116/IS110/IS902 family
MQVQMGYAEDSGVSGRQGLGTAGLGGLISGERQRRGRITKAGNTRMRWLLVQAAMSILRCRHRQTEALRGWATRIVARRGKKIAVVALARRLAGILYALLHDGTTYDPRSVPRHAAEAAVPV